MGLIGRKLIGNRAYGDEGERAACDYLKKRGWKIVERNVRRAGDEIDIIARKKDLTAFVEVKRRNTTDYGEAAEAVDRRKMRHIARAAKIYAYEKGLEDSPQRFDIIEVTPNGINHIEDAFDLTDLFR